MQLNVSLVVNCLAVEESQEKEGEKMDKSGRFAIFSPSRLLYWGNDGIRNCRKSRVNQGIIIGIFSFFRVYFRLSLWLFCCYAPYALAEWDSTDSGRLLDIYVEIRTWQASQNTKFDLLKSYLNAYNGGSVGDNVADIENELERIYNALGYSYGSSARHLADDMADVNENLVDIHDNITGLYDGLESLESIYVRLGEILDALDDNTGGSGGEISSDIATETTLSAFKGKYEELANQYLTSWGFSGGSGGTYRDYLDNLYRFQPYVLHDSYSSAGTVPFPNETHKWYYLYYPSKTSMNFDNPYEALSWSFSQSLQTFNEVLYMNQLKMEWNDWYAHTNLISTLHDIYQQPKNYVDKSEDIGSVNDENGEMSITYNDAEGGSPPTPEVIDTKIVFTNDFAQLETDADDMDDTLDDINYSKMKDIYKVPEGIESQGYRDYSQVESIPDYQIQYGNDKSFSFVFGASQRQIYNSILSPALLNNLRNVFSKLWLFLSVYFNFVLFKIFGKVND